MPLCLQLFMKIIMFFKMTVLCDGIMSLRNKRARISSVLLNVRSKILTIYSFIIINIALTSYLSNIILDALDSPGKVSSTWKCERETVIYFKILLSYMLYTLPLSNRNGLRSGQLIIQVTLSRQ